MKTHTLKAEKRQVTGRKVKHLRASGVVPATVYGRDVASISVSVQRDQVLPLYREVGETGVVSLEVTSESSPRPVMFHTVQSHPVTKEVMHIEFRQVNLKQKISASVPLIVEGVSPAVEEKTGLVLTLVSTVDVEALPTDIPDHLAVDVSRLAAVGEEVTAGDLILPKDVTLLTEPSISLVRIAPLIQKEEPTEVPATEEAQTEAPEETQQSETGATEEESSE